MLVKSGFEKLRALQAAEKLHFWGFVTGHDFSRADKANEINRALAPAEVPWAKFLEIKPFSAACLAPAGLHWAIREKIAALDPPLCRNRHSCR